MAPRWVICENPAPSDFREIEVIYGELASIPYCRKFIRLCPDGRVEIGEKHSDFRAEYRTEVLG